MATTTNFGWTTPDDTDLVKDGAAAIRTLGSSIDTSLVDLNGGTTGQVLTKASDTDLDFSFTTPAANPLTTTGDIIYSSSGATAARLGIGTAAQVLAVNSGATAPEWVAAPAAGGMTLISTTSLSGSSIDLTSISSTYVDLRIEISDYYMSADAVLQFRINNDTSTRRASYYAEIDATSGALTDDIAINTTTLTSLNQINTVDNQNKNNLCVIEFFNYTSTGPKLIRGTNYFFNQTNSECFCITNTVIDATSAISSIQILTNTGTFSAGTVKLWGIK